MCGWWHWLLVCTCLCLLSQISHRKSWSFSPIRAGEPLLRTAVRQWTRQYQGWSFCFNRELSEEQFQWCHQLVPVLNADGCSLKLGCCKCRANLGESTGGAVLHPRGRPVKRQDFFAESTCAYASGLHGQQNRNAPGMQRVLLMLSEFAMTSENRILSTYWCWCFRWFSVHFQMSAMFVLWVLFLYRLQAASRGVQFNTRSLEAGAGHRSELKEGGRWHLALLGKHDRWHDLVFGSLFDLVCESCSV